MRIGGTHAASAQSPSHCGESCPSTSQDFSPAPTPVHVPSDASRSSTVRRAMRTTGATVTLGLTKKGGNRWSNADSTAGGAAASCDDAGPSAAVGGLVAGVFTTKLIISWAAPPRLAANSTGEGDVGGGAKQRAAGPTSPTLASLVSVLGLTSFLAASLMSLLSAFVAARSRSSAASLSLRSASRAARASSFSASLAALAAAASARLRSWVASGPGARKPGRKRVRTGCGAGRPAQIATLDVRAPGPPWRCARHAPVHRPPGQQQQRPDQPFSVVWGRAPSHYARTLAAWSTVAFSSSARAASAIVSCVFRTPHVQDTTRSGHHTFKTPPRSGRHTFRTPRVQDATRSGRHAFRTARFADITL